MHTRGIRFGHNFYRRVSSGGQSEKGAAMVEMAFVLTLLVTLLVGVTSAAIAFGQNNSIENAAREASRYAATLPGPADTVWLQDVRDVPVPPALEIWTQR